MVLEKLKEIFGGGRGEEEEIEEEKVERVSIEKLPERIKEKKNQLIEDTRKELHSLLEKISNILVKLEDLKDNLASAESSEDVHANLYKSANEAKRLLVRKMDRAIENLDVSFEGKWKNLLNFNRDLQDSLNLLKNARISHSNQVSALYEGKMNKLMRLTDRLQSLSKELNTDLRKTNLELEELDDFLEEVEKKSGLEEKKAKLKENLNELKNRKEDIEEDYNRVKESLESLKKSKRFEELEEIKQKKKELEKKKKRICKKINSNLSDIARPLRKMSKLIERNEHMVSKEVLDAIDMYLDDPEEAALSEEEGLPKLNSLLEELEIALRDKMKLSEKERKKRLEEIRDMIENERVAKLRNKYFEIENKQENYRKERESSSLLDKKERLEKSVEDKESELEKTKDRIEDLDEEIEKITRKIQEKNSLIRKKAGSDLELEIEDIQE